VSEGGRLLPRIDAAWAELDALVDALGPNGLTRATSGGWAVKDHLTHVAAWELWLIGLLGRTNRWVAMGITDRGKKTVESVNKQVHALHRGKSAAEAVAYFRETHEQLISALESMTDADLALPYVDYQPGAAGEEGSDQAVVVWVAANTYEHYAEHVGWLRA
jgi:uncharacterized protein (TIGR03083 family)